MSEQSLTNKQLMVISINILVAIVALASAIIISHILTEKYYAVVASILSIVTIVSTLQGLGLNAGLINNLSNTAKQERAKLFKNILFIRLIIISFVFILCLLTSQFLIQDSINREYLNYGFLTFFSFAFVELSTLHHSYLIALDKVKGASVCLATGQLLQAFLCVALTINYGIFGFFIALPTASCITLLAYHLMLTRNIYVNSGTITIADTIRLLLPTSTISYFTKLVYVVWIRSPFIILSYAGFYEISANLFLALQFSEKIRQFGTSVAGVNLAHLNNKLIIDKEEHWREFTYNFYKFVKILAIISVPILLLSPIFFSLVYPNSYDTVGANFLLLFIFSGIFIHLNWVGAGVIYPYKNFTGILKFQAVSKLIGLMLIIIVFNFTKSITIALVLFCITELSALAFYYRRATVISSNKNIFTFNQILFLVLVYVLFSGLSLGLDSILHT